MGERVDTDKKISSGAEGLSWDDDVTAVHQPEQWSAEECELMLGIAAQCERRAELRAKAEVAS